MWRRQLLASIVAAALAVAAFSSRTLVGEGIPVWVPLVPIALVAGLAAWWQVAPDARFVRCRPYCVAAAAASLIEEDIGHKEPANQQGQLRVHVFTRHVPLYPRLVRRGRGKKQWRFWWIERLVPRFTYPDPSARMAEADAGMAWDAGMGLVWMCAEEGRPLFAKNGDELWRKSELTRDKEKRVKDVRAVLVVPLKKVVEIESEADSSKVLAVLALDALTPAAEKVLSEQFDRLTERKNTALLQRAQYVSLFFC